MGTDLTYEDFERRYVEDYNVVGLGKSNLGGESVYLVEAIPKYESAHSRAVYTIATADFAILEVRYFRKGMKDLIKIQRASRSGMVVIAGHTLPTILVVENLVQRSRTDVKLTQIHVDPQLDDGMFSRSAFEIGRPIPLL